VILRKNYGEIFEGNEIWRNLEVPTVSLYKMDKDSTYIKEFHSSTVSSEKPNHLRDIKDARSLVSIRR